MGERFILEFDRFIRTVSGTCIGCRPRPDAQMADLSWSVSDKKHIVGLMRVNYVGEVCAQALYQSQRLWARDEQISNYLLQVASEEMDHLSWCKERMLELGGSVTILAPMWYVGSLLIGSLASMVGDHWNLGFLAETEKQVSRHLQRHLRCLPTQDRKSSTILAVIQKEEEQHQHKAESLGARVLPTPCVWFMNALSRVMVAVAYRV